MDGGWASELVKGHGELTLSITIELFSSTSSNSDDI